MQHQFIAGHRADPSVSIDSPKFVYVNAASTDIRKTFDRVRARMSVARAEKQNSVVRELHRATSI